MSEQSSSAGPYGRGTGNLPPPPPTGHRRRWWFITPVIAILLSILVLLFFLPRPTAVVTLRPIIKAQSGAVAGSYTPRSLLPSSQQGTQTGKTASGSQACGTLTFKNYTPLWVTIPVGTVVSNGTSQQVMTEKTIQVPPDPIIPGVASVSAKAVKAGKSGNIPAMSINQLYASGVYVLNRAAFSGGIDNQVVRQSDIDRIANPLVNSLQQAALKDLQSQLTSGELFFKANPVCSAPMITSNPGVGSSTVEFTVSASLQCTDSAYNPRTVPSQTEAILKQQAVQLLNPGPDFVLDGDVAIRIDKETPGADGQVGVQATASGIWMYHFTAATKLGMVKHIARATVSDAKAWLLQQDGVSQVSISVSGPVFDLSGDGVLPDDLRAITING
jgi:hypothetical protein